MFFAKIISIILIFITSSCAFKNSAAVFLAIDSDPVGAKIYIDGKYYGETVKELKLVPDRDYNLTLVKDGYKTINYVMKTKFDLRKKRYAQHRRCRTDLLGSIFILPIVGLKSAHCRDFEREIYNFDLELLTPYSGYGNHYIPPQYIPPQSIETAQKIYSQPVPAYPPQNMPPQNYIPQTFAGDYENPYQTYNPPSAGQPSYQRPMDYDNSYKAPTYGQNYQPESVNIGGNGYSMVGEDPNRPRSQQQNNYYSGGYNDNDNGYVAPYRQMNSTSEFVNDGGAGGRPSGAY